MSQYRSRRLVGLDSIMGDQMSIFHDRYYPMHTSLLASKLPVAASKTISSNCSTFACFLNSLDIISKMHILVIVSFQEVCLVIKQQNFFENAIKLHFIPFCLKNNANK